MVTLSHEFLAAITQFGDECFLCGMGREDNQPADCTFGPSPQQLGPFLKRVLRPTFEPPQLPAHRRCLGFHLLPDGRMPMRVVLEYEQRIADNINVAREKMKHARANRPFARLLRWAMGREGPAPDTNEDVTLRYWMERLQ